MAAERASAESKLAVLRAALNKLQLISDERPQGYVMQRMSTSGKIEFSPTPEEAQRSARLLYEAQRTLVVRFLDDSLDETTRAAEVVLAATVLTACALTGLIGELPRRKQTTNTMTSKTSDTAPAMPPMRPGMRALLLLPAGVVVGPLL